MGVSFTVPLDEIQPSQCYLNGRKVALAAEWFDFDDPDYDPLPVRRFDGVSDDRWTLTDGHTRAFLAGLAGVDELVVREDTDDIPVDLYEECIGWCRTEGVVHVEDLVGRVVGPNTFESVWVERCRDAAERLEEA